MNDERDEQSAGGPAEAARLVQEVQELGFQAARTVVERFAELFAQFTTVGGGEPRHVSDDRPPFGFWGFDRSGQAMQSDIQRAAESYFAVMGQLNEAGLRFFDATRWPQPPAPREAGLQLPDISPGGRVSARLWLHNTTTTSALALRPWCPGLFSHRGASLPPSAVTFTPERIDRLDPDASRDVLVAADVREDADPGAYHGQILVDGLPDVVFAFRVTVLPDMDRP